MLERALKVLQRARTWNDGSRSQAEIAANISFLEWRIGKLDRSATMTALHRELIRCEYKSVGIARMLASLLSHPTDLPQLEALYQGLAEVNDDEKLLSIQSMIAFLRRDFAAATEFAEAWASAEPFNADAAQMLTFLLADYYGDYRRAAKVGVAALGRVPNSWMLANNVSYTLALDGRIDEAKRFLPPSTVNPYIVATAALIEFLSGNTDRGVSGYERAAALAEASGDDQLARLIRLRAFVLMRGQSLSFEEARSIGDEPEGSDPRITLIWRQADRLGVEWPFKNTGRLAD
jgi:Flp pilus assembly protein TadD